MTIGEPNPSIALDPQAIVEVETALREREALIERARETAAHALFFLRLLIPTRNPQVNQSIENYREFVGHQLQALGFIQPGSTIVIAPLRALIDARWEERTAVERGEIGFSRPDEIAAGRLAVRGWLATVLREAKGDGRFGDRSWKLAFELVRREIETSELVEEWGSIESAMDGMALATSSDHDRKLRYALIGFLSRKRSGRLAERVFHRWIPDVLRFLHKHLALLLVSALVAVVLLEVEAVNSLVMNLGAPTILVAFFTLLPLLVTQLWILSLRIASGGELVHPWDIGGPSHRSFRAASLEPGPSVLRYGTEREAVMAAATRQWGQALSRKLGQLWRQRADPKALLGSAASDIKQRVQTIHRGRSRSIVGAILRGLALKMGAYLLWWLVLFGGLAAGWQAGRIPSTILTVFGILSFLYMLLIWARLVDLWEFLDPHPVRFRLLVLGLTVLLATLLGWGRSSLILGLLLAAGWLLWSFRQRPGRLRYLFLAPICLVLVAGLALQANTREKSVWQPVAETAGSDWRIEAGDWPHPGQSPVVVVAASGGGSRAAVYTGLTLRNLGRRENGCRSLSDGPRPCRSCPAIGAQLHAISSVSGGSLANAAYLVRSLSPRPNDTDLIQALGDDFLRPTLLGAVLPGTSRGDAIERFWQGLDDLARSCTGRSPQAPVRGSGPGAALGNYCLGDLAALWRGSVARARTQSGEGARPPFPLPLFNTSTLDGHNVVITPLPVELYTRPEDRQVLDSQDNPYSRKGTTWIFYRDGIYGLEDLLGAGFDPLLSSAVRASANFPFGFPLVEIRTDRDQFLSPLLATHRGSEQTVYLTDGGALSNSGMWSLFQLLREKADELRSRGVLLLVIDASRMPTMGLAERTVLGLRATIGDQAPIGQYLHRTMLDLLQEIYGANLAVAQIDLTPQVDRNVMTTWALDGRTLALLEDTFERQWCAEQELLERQWSFLDTSQAKREAQAPPPWLIDSARPPAD